LNGTLSHTTRDTYTIEYNLDNVEAEYLISFEGQAIGSLILSNSFFVVNEKNLTITYVDTPTQKRIVLQLDAQICPVKEGRTREFLLNFNLNDASCSGTLTLSYGTPSSVPGQYYWDGVSTLSWEMSIDVIINICITPTNGSQFIVGCPQYPFLTFILLSNGTTTEINQFTTYTWNNGTWSK
jgi:hypothetical protein